MQYETIDEWWELSLIHRIRPPNSSNPTAPIALRVPLSPTGPHPSPHGDAAASALLSLALIRRRRRHTQRSSPSRAVNPPSAAARFLSSAVVASLLRRPSAVVASLLRRPFLIPPLPRGPLPLSAPPLPARVHPAASLPSTKIATIAADRHRPPPPNADLAAQRRASIPLAVLTLRPRRRSPAAADPTLALAQISDTNDPFQSGTSLKVSTSTLRT